MFLYIGFSNIYFSIDNINYPLNFLVTMNFKDFINFNFEKLLFVETTVTSIINELLKRIHAIGKEFVRFI